MDTSPQVDTTTGAGDQTRPTTKRRFRSVEEKRRIVEKTLVKGSSVARVAREHGVNANQVFGWRTLYKSGKLGGRSPKLLPATIADSKHSYKRHWSVETRQQVVAASLAPGACVQAIAEAHGVHPSLIYDWRKKYGRKTRSEKARQVDLLPVTLSDASGTQNHGVVPPVRAIEIELPKGRLRILGADASLLRAAMEILK